MLHRLATRTVPSPDLAPILQSGVNIVCVPRPIDPFMAQRLNRVATNQTFARAAKIDATRPDPSALLESIRDPLVAAHLSQDIQYLTSQLGALLKRRHVHARLFVQRSDGCRKIHADNVRIRLLCTYAGPGTDWLPDSDLVRKHLGRTDVDVEAANRSVIRPGAALQQTAPGEIILLKGKKYAGNEAAGAAHRSPLVEATGASRLVLKIDEAGCGC